MPQRFQVLVNDPIKVAYVDRFRHEKGGLGRADVIKMALAEFMVNHPLDGENGRDKQAEALRVYRVIGELRPSVLQRNRIADSYADAVAIIRALVESGNVDSARVFDVA